MPNTRPTTIRLADYTPSPYLIDTIDLDVLLHPTRTKVASTLKIRPNPEAASTGEPLRLDGEAITLQSIAIDGKTLAPGDYMTGKDSLTVRRPPRGNFTLTIVTHCSPDTNKSLSGLYRSRGIYCTQCEAQGFRRITYAIDRPDVLSVYTTRLEAETADVPVLLSNGNLVDSGRVPGTTRHFATWHDPFPKPSYLFAMVGGNLAVVKDTFTTRSKRKVDLRIYVEPGKEDRCAWAMDSLKRSMKWDEKRFGLEYDLDIFMIVAVSDFNMGAMENKGLNVFNDRLVLASPKTATDANFEAIESVIAHEYFHNWTGNRITCRDWFQLCLKEGLTVFRDQEFSADERSRAVQRIADVRQLKSAQFPEDAGPLAHPVRPDTYIEINNFYTATVYEKGAELCRMLEALLGRDGFRKAMDLYFKRHDGEAATVEDFIACMADASGRDLTQFMTWYSQAGTPELVCDLRYDARTKTAELSVEQVLPPTPGETKKKPLHMPLRMGLIGADGRDLPLVLADGRVVKNGIVELTKRSETFRFKDIPARPVPSLLRGFSAPVNLTIDLSDADLRFLMAHDSDLYNRWQASQDYATRVMIAAVAAIRKGEKAEKPTAFVEALGQTLGNDALDPGYRAQFATLPSESDLARVIGRNVDPAAIYKARRMLRRAIGTGLGDVLERLYEAMADKGPYSPLPVPAGRRALRNACLALLAQRGTADDVQRVARHFSKASNATDEVSALGILSEIKGPERDKAFDRFHSRWKNDHLMIDNWFAYQAASPLPSTLAAVKKLTRDPLFSIKNPNKVRALIGTFAAGNPVNFNRPDGKGYAFLADKVLEIDRFNPQVAARMLAAFRSWRTLESVRRDVAQTELKRIAAAKPLSDDVFEIVTKMLD